MDPSSLRYSRSPNVVSAPLGEGVALLELTSNSYFSLDAVGAVVWARLETPASRDELVLAVTGQYEVSAETCAQDVSLLLEELSNAALVQPDAAQS